MEEGCGGDQAKQKRNNRKPKDKARDEKPSVVIEEKPKKQSPIEDDADLLKKPVDPLEEVSDVSDSVECATESLLRPDSDDRDSSPVNWDTDTSEPHHPSTEACSSGVVSEQNGGRRCLDDNTSTCSTDSLPSVKISGPAYRPYSHQNHKTQSSPNRGKVKSGKDSGQLHAECDGVEQDVVKKLEEVVSLQKKISIKGETESRLKDKPTTVSVKPSSPQSPSKASPRAVQKPDLKKTTENTNGPVVSKPYPQVIMTQKPPEPPKKPSIVHQQPASPAQKTMNGQVTTTMATKPVPPVSRPLSAPLVDGSRPNATSAASTTPAISMVQAGPFLSRSIVIMSRPLVIQFSSVNI